MIKKELLNEAERSINSIGGLLVSGNSPPNVMSLIWGAFGTFWHKPVFIAPVRYSKYTHDLIEKHGEFAISIPRKDFSDIIAKSVNVSGRTRNKFDYLNLHATKCRTINSYIVGDFGLHFECRVVFKAGMETYQLLDSKIQKEFYGNKDFHSMYFAEVVDVYET